ncbi:uncharacterized protein LOC62_03G005151 [Vanrija pseudolonga]|uniref:Uncharacterized protein n=1 Tax=Vanrija pseudolonga TaxID=143232 RepID=A0AAF1BR26_9TREE|nr:hypothetical protein LOC62_03G005151 [Vanrija pseudolonga]
MLPTSFSIIPPTEDQPALLCIEVNGHKTFLPWLVRLDDGDEVTVAEFEPAMTAAVSWAEEAAGIREACKPLEGGKWIVLDTHKTLLARSLRHAEVEIQIITNGLEHITEAHYAQFWRLIPNSLTMWAMYTKLAKMLSTVRFLQAHLATPCDKDYEEELAKMCVPWPITHTKLGYWAALRFDAAGATTKMAELIESVGEKVEVLAADVLQVCAPALLK